jgi:hypothetical protein
MKLYAQIIISLCFCFALLFLGCRSEGNGHSMIAGRLSAGDDPPNLTISSSHPRLWITPDRLARMKQFAARGTTRWTNLLRAADAARDSDNANPDDIPLLGLVYQVTGDSKYGDAAVRILMATAIPDNVLMSDDGYPYRTVMPDVAAGLDWCHDRMTSAQRHTVAGWLMDRADHAWPETNPSRAGSWGLWPSNNYFWGFLMTSIAAIAAYGDDTGVGQYSGKNRPRYHLTLGVRKWQKQVLPWAAQFGRGGMFAESTNYDSTFRMALIVDGIRTATGIDLSQERGFSYLPESILWRVHSTVPGNDCYYPLGDQSRVSEAPLCDYDRERAYAAAALTADPKLRRYAKFWLDHISPDIAQWPATMAWEFLYYDDDSPSRDFTGELPPYYFAPGSGVLLRRSDWSNTATYFGIWAGPLLESHQDRDVNGFEIYKGAWLAGNASIWSNSGILNDTGYHNNITFGGQGQTLQDGDSTSPTPDAFGGEVLKQENTPDYTYFAGSGARAYSKIGAREYIRKLVFLSPGTFVILDRVAPPPSRPAIEWHLHSRTPIQLDGRGYRFDNGSFALNGSLLLPVSNATLTTAPEDNGPKHGTSSYRLDITVNRGDAKTYLLNVFQLTAASQATPPSLPRVVESTNGNMEGAQIGHSVVMFGTSDNVSGKISYPVDATTKLDHTDVDLRPHTRYRLTAGPATSTVTTTAAGTLRFSTPAGASHIELAPFR